MIRDVLFTRTFESNDDFGATRAAEKFIADLGLDYGLGSPQRGAPRGLMFGPYDVMKWRNLSDIDRAMLHGTLTGDGRRGPVTLTVYTTAPAEAHDALRWHDSAGVVAAAVHGAATLALFAAIVAPWFVRI